MLFYIAALLLVLIGIAHSYLGERYILIRLFRRGNLPKLFGGEQFTKNTLRFAWHITTIAWWGFAALVIQLSESELNRNALINIIAITFLLHGAVSFWGAKGKHLSWLFFLAIGLCLLFVPAP